MLYEIRAKRGTHETLTRTNKRAARRLARRWAGELEVGNRVVAEGPSGPFACYTRTPAGVRKLFL